MIKLFIFMIFVNTEAFRDANVNTSNPLWNTVCREVKPVHLFYERFDSSVGEQISCRIRGKNLQFMLNGENKVYSSIVNFFESLNLRSLFKKSEEKIFFP